MTKLTSENAQKAADWLQKNARPLELAQYDYHFENGAAAAVLAALAPFQNNDGGFGHGLESDVRLPASSVLCTTVALQKLRQIKATADAPMVQKAIAYLLAQRTAAGGWRNVPDNVSDAPHAPWWSADGDHVAVNFANPAAEVAGYLVEHGASMPGLVTAHIDHLANQKAADVEMHDLFCYQRLLESPGLAAADYDRLLTALRPAIAANVSADPAQWGDYGLRPLDMVSSPESVFAGLFDVTADLAHRVAEQHTDGYWQPAWSWAFVSAEVWATAEQEIRGQLTLNNLLLFKNFNWLEHNNG